MTEFFKFAAENPYLTFFLLLLIYMAVTESLKWIAYAIKGAPPVEEEQEEDDE